MNKLTQNKGITLLEVMVTLSLAAGLYLAVGQLGVALKDSTRRMEDKLLAVSSEALGSRQTWQDIRKGGMSFNTVSQRDDESRNFYDYLPDVNCLVNCSRRLTLIPGKGEFTLMIQDGLRGAPIVLNPNTFYDLDGAVPDPTDPSAAGTIAFNEGKLLETIAAENPEFLRGSALLHFYSLVEGRPGGAVARQLPPRTANYLSVFSEEFESDTGESFIDVDTATSKIVAQHPSYAFRYASLDSFFRGLPSIGGRNAFAMVQAVQLVQYKVAPINDEGSPSGALLRSVYDPETGAYGEGVVLAKPICGLELVRTRVDIPSIRATVIEDNRVSDRRVAQAGQNCPRNDLGEIELPDSRETID